MNATDAKLDALGHTLDDLLNGPINDVVSAMFAEVPTERTGFMLLLFPHPSLIDCHFISNCGRSPHDMIAMLRRAADKIELLAAPAGGRA